MKDELTLKTGLVGCGVWNHPTKDTAQEGKVWNGEKDETKKAMYIQLSDR